MSILTLSVNWFHRFRVCKTSEISALKATEHLQSTYNVKKKNPKKQQQKKTQGKAKWWLIF